MVEQTMRVEQINQITLAKKLNLSTATVSRSLRNHPDISPATRDRVLQEAARMGYRLPDPSNPGLKGSLLLGVFLAQNPSAHITPVERMYMTGMSQIAQEANSLLFTHYLSGVGDERILDPTRQPPALRSGMVAGLALIHAYKTEVVSDLSAQLPCVTITHHVASTQADHVDSDHDNGMLALTEHLISLGHKRIGFIRYTSSTFSFSRLASFIKSHYRLGLSWDPSLEERIKTEGDVNEEKELIERIVARSQRDVTAWVCDSDANAYSIYRQLTERGIKIPKKISLTGYDGLTPFENCPQLTTVKVPFVEMGKAAIRQLLARIQDPKMRPRQILLRCEFLEGTTTGPVRSS